MSTNAPLVDSATSAADATSYTFSSMALGAADADRHILVGIAGRAGGNYLISSVTVGGVSATVKAHLRSSQAYASWYLAAVPTGTTGDVVITYNNTMSRVAIAVYRLLDPVSTTATDSDTSVADPATVNLDIAANGVAFGLAVCSGTQTSISWTNLTSDVNAFAAGWEANGNAGWASADFASAQTGLALTGDFGSAASGPSAAFVSFELAGGGGASTITAAAGTATASTVAASSTAASAITSATGAATASTLTGSAVVAGAITAAAGVGTGETLVGDTLAAGSAAIVAADGVATTATLGGSSVAAAAIGVAAGAATAATVSGYDITPVVPDVTSVGRRRKTRAQRLQDYDVPMPVEVLTSTVPSDKVIEPIAAPKVEPVPAKASKLAKPKPKKPDAPAPEVKAKAKSPTPKKPAAQVQAPEPVKAVAAPRPMMLSDILSAETMTPEEMVAAVKLLARIQLGPQLIRSTPKAKLIRA